MLATRSVPKQERRPSLTAPFSRGHAGCRLTRSRASGSQTEALALFLGLWYPEAIKLAGLIRWARQPWTGSTLSPRTQRIRGKGFINAKQSICLTCSFWSNRHVGTY